VERVVEREAAKFQCNQRSRRDPSCYLCRSGYGCRVAGLSECIGHRFDSDRRLPARSGNSNANVRCRGPDMPDRAIVPFTRLFTRFVSTLAAVAA
jgi:hypothetical protein